jgi:hypothetical protein
VPKPCSRYNKWCFKEDEDSRGSLLEKLIRNDQQSDYIESELSYQSRLQQLALEILNTGSEDD